MLLKKVLMLIAITQTHFSSVYAQDKPDTCGIGALNSAPDYSATQWYRDSAEKVAQYNQIFNLGLEKIQATYQQRHLKAGHWGVILDIDETVLDNSAYAKHNVLTCQHYSESTMYAFMEKKVSIATPGAVKFTCAIQKLGGKVILVTNRNGNFDANLQNATLDNLKQEKLCFDNVVFASSDQDKDKTPRFNAVIKGNYAHIIALKHLPPLNIIAYFGDNIQDFPGTTQKNAIKLNYDDKFYAKFGKEYFSLPNPTYGSWQANPFN